MFRLNFIHLSSKDLSFNTKTVRGENFFVMDSFYNLKNGRRETKYNKFDEKLLISNTN